MKNIMKPTYFIFVLACCTAMFYQLHAQGTEEKDPLLKAKALYISEDYQTALEWLSKAEEPSGDEEVKTLEGKIYLHLQDYPAAIRACQKAAAENPEKASYTLAQAYALSGQYDSALVWLEKHLTSPYRKPAGEIQLDPAFTALERTRGWRTLWAKEYYSDKEKTESRARYLLQSGNFTATLAYLNDSIKKHDYHALYSIRGQVYDSLKNYKAAYADMQEALTLERKPEYYLLSASVAMNLEDYEAARTDASNALRLDPSLFNAYLLRAKAKVALGDYSTAISDMDSYLNYFPRDAAGLNLAGRISLEDENYLKALTYYNKALKISKAEPDYFSGRGKAYLQTGMHEYAQRDFSMALDLNPKNGELWYLKGLARQQSGDEAGACNDFEKAFKRGYKPALDELQKNCKSRF